mmetsp:Transcript_36752/g.58278  ORF Transcript_36752/g.58278 Transcript_36752/m.58278 type:complete len:81 (+) Transcript_36752:479-721(+)
MFVSFQDSCLYGRTISYSLIRIDALVQVPLIKEITQLLLDFWNASRPSNKDNFMDFALLELSILQRLLYWCQSTTEQVSI